MKAEWLANVGGQEYGPYTWDQLRQMAAEGRVVPELPIRKQSDPQWSPASSIPGLLGGAAKNGNGQAARPASASSSSGTIASSKTAVLKKARPLGPPPVAGAKSVPPVVTARGNLPTGVPVGLPVGTPVGGEPVVGPPAPPPFNFSVSSASSVGSSARAGAGPDDDDEGPIRKKQTSPLLLVGILGGVAAAVALVGGLIVYFAMNRGSSDESQLAAANALASETTRSETESAEANPIEANAGDATALPAARRNSQGAAAKAGGGSESPPAKGSDAKSTAAALKTIPEKEWRSVAKIVSFGVGNAKVQIIRIWLASDLSGELPVFTPPAPATEAAAEVPDKERSAAKAKPAPQAEPTQKYLFVELSITNNAGVPLKYKGWNVEKKNVPFAIDEQDRVWKLIPTSQTPKVARLGKTDVPGGTTVSEILVFEGPADAAGNLRLVLPETVFYDKTPKPYFGLVVTPDVVSDGGASPVPPAAANLANGKAGDAAIVGRQVPSEPGKVEGVIPEEPKPETKPETRPAPAKEEPKPKPPSLIDEINKFEEDLKKKEEMEKNDKETAGKQGVKK